MQSQLQLQGKRIALLVAEMYQELEFWYPYYRLREAGAEVVPVGPAKAVYKSKLGYPAEAKLSAERAKAEDFDAVVIPGGYAPDYLRRHEPVIRFVRAMHDQGKVVAAICHAGWVLASAGVLQGKKVTSFFSIRDDLENAGAEWVDQEVVRDGNLITSRFPDDLPAFCRTIIEVLSE